MVKCELCGFHFEKITWTHLWYAHDEMTLGEYEERFPEAPLVSEECSRRTSDAISEAKLGVPVWTEERKKEWSERVSGEGNPNYGHTGYSFSFDPRVDLIDWDKVRELVVQGKTSNEICGEIGIVRATLYKHIEERFPDLFPKFVGRDKIYRATGRSRGGQAKKGQPSPLKGKTYLDIFGSEEEAKARAKVTSDWMKTDRNIRRFVRHPSRPQVKLFSIVKDLYPEAKMEYSVEVPIVGGTIYLDIGIPSQMLDIEYDGRFWHEDEDLDSDRDKVLQILGWKIVRFRKEDLDDTPHLRDILLGSGRGYLYWYPYSLYPVGWL
ncbi:hypothetical protein ES703_87399 [subsurface metagenome]